MSRSVPESDQAPELNRAPATPCRECPWRVSNQGRPVPDKYAGTYDREQRLTLWSELRERGYQQACHLSASDRKMFPNGDDPEWTAAGFQAIPDNARLRECGGAVAAALREMRLLDAEGSLEAYEQERPKGFTREVAALWALRMRGVVVPGFPPLRPIDVEDAEIIDPVTQDDVSTVDLMPTEKLSALVARLGAILDDGISQRWT